MEMPATVCKVSEFHCKSPEQHGVPEDKICGSSAWGWNLPKRGDCAHFRVCFPECPGSRYCSAAFNVNETALFHLRLGYWGYKLKSKTWAETQPPISQIVSSYLAGPRSRTPRKGWSMCVTGTRAPNWSIRPSSEKCSSESRTALVPTAQQCSRISGHLHAGCSPHPCSALFRPALLPGG